MRVDDTLVYLLALTTGVVLFLGLARALDNPRPSRWARRARTACPEPPSRVASGPQASHPGAESAGVCEPAGVIPESSAVTQVIARPWQLKQLEIDEGSPPQAHSSEAPEPLAAESCNALEQEAAALCARREYARARILVQEALASEIRVGGCEETLREILWKSVTGEIGRLAGRALRPGRKGADALAGLAQAEAAVGAVSAEITGAGNREDLNRRLWWGYMKLGVQRTDSGDFEPALEAFSHALRLAAGDPERQGLTRRSLGRALDGAADRAGEDVTRLLEEGNRSAAEACGCAMSEAVDRALADGLAPEEVVGVIAKRQGLMLRIAEGRPS